MAEPVTRADELCSDGQCGECWGCLHDDRDEKPRHEAPRIGLAMEIRGDDPYGNSGP